jgi:hypothetical protein
LTLLAILRIHYWAGRVRMTFIEMVIVWYWCVCWKRLFLPNTALAICCIEVDSLSWDNIERLYMDETCDPILVRLISPYNVLPACFSMAF